MKRNVIFTLIVVIVAATFFSLGWFLKSKKNQSQIEPIGNEEPKSQMDSIRDAMYPEYLVYGMPQEKDHQRQIVDYLYKFRYIIIGGCVVDEATRVRADKNNRKTDSIMTIRYGKNWHDKFNNSVDSLYSIDSIAIDIAQKDKRIVKIEAQLEDNKKKYALNIGLNYSCYETPDNNIKMVMLMADGLINGKAVYMSQIRAAVDLKRKKVIDLDSRPFH